MQIYSWLQEQEDPPFFFKPHMAHNASCQQQVFHKRAVPLSLRAAPTHTSNLVPLIGFDFWLHLAEGLMFKHCMQCGQEQYNDFYVISPQIISIIVHVTWSDPISGFIYKYR